MVGYWYFLVANAHGTGGFQSYEHREPNAGELLGSIGPLANTCTWTNPELEDLLMSVSNLWDITTHYAVRTIS